MNLPAPPTLVEVVVCAACGTLLGLAHFTLLRWNTRLYFEGHPVAALTLQALRIAGAAALLAFTARFGIWPLLLALSGFLAGRGTVLRAGQRT